MYAVDVQQSNLGTHSHALSAEIYLCECARGLLALAPRRKRVDGADVQESTFGHANDVSQLFMERAVLYNNTRYYILYGLDFTFNVAHTRHRLRTLR